MAETSRILQGQAQQPAVGWYVYAFIAHRQVPPLAGIDEVSPLTLIVEQGIGALVSQVPLPEFGGEALSRNLKDLRWLEAKVRRHSGIVVEAAAGGPVLPMQFGTIFLDRARIVAVIRRNVATLQAALDHLQGKEEWGVTGMFQPTALRATLLRTDPALLTLSKRLCSASTGHAYLLEKCLEELSSVKVRARETALACSAREAVRGKADELVVETPVLPRAAGDEEVFLTLACLLKRDSVGMFLDELERWNRRHAEEGVGLCASGPWPPYHFTPRLEPA